MINKRLIGLVPEAKSHIKKSVIYQLFSLFNNIVLIFLLGDILDKAMKGYLYQTDMYIMIFFVVLFIVVRYVCILQVNKENFYASSSVKNILRKKIYEKTCLLGGGYTKELSTAQIVQITSEGVEQLEIYFSSYLPQFFYAMIAPIVLFIAITYLSLKVAFVLLVCVPLIPISIVIVQKIAKKLLGKYWDEYTKLGDHFLENLQGLTTLKIYNADDFMHQKMNKQAEVFRKITMRVLTMQLNSISIMDIMAYGGAAVGIILAFYECMNHTLSISGVFIIILLSADFFLPMRLLGSFFHVAMNGMAASKKIFMLLDMELPSQGSESFSNGNIHIDSMSFEYDKDQTIIKNINMEIKQNSFVSIVGQSGCGKSTIAGILLKANKGYTGSIAINKKELSSIKESDIYDNITLVSAFSYIFKGTIRDNLRMANKKATEDQMLEVLRKVRLEEFVLSQGGLDMPLLERGSNLSGGQCQRLAIARALLHDSDIYIFDEATSNIDVESEDAILSLIHSLKDTKTIIFISHRLNNVVNSDVIYLMEDGEILTQGTHYQLLETNDYYQDLWKTQKEEVMIKEEN